MKVVKQMIILAVIVFLFPFQAYAEEEKGMIKIHLTDGEMKTEKEGVVFQYKRIGDIKETDQERTAAEIEKKTDELVKETVSYDGEVKTDRDGNAWTGNLLRGVYLFKVKDNAEYETVRPFLVSVPMWDEVKETMNYEVEVLPKHSQTKEKRAEAPQTGRNEYGQLLYMAGILLFILSLILVVSGKSKERPYEKDERKHKVIREKAKRKEGIDFPMLKKINPDIKGWIYVPGTSIDYPVLIGRNNTVYLKKDYEGKESISGSVFSFCDARADLMDAHLCLFAHNMRSPQMFGELKKYKREDFAKRHMTAYLYTPQGTREYELFSVYECNKKDVTFEHKMSADSEQFQKLKIHMLRHNMHERNAPCDIKSRQILTLSCCSDHDRKRNRVVVNFGFTCAKK